LDLVAMDIRRFTCWATATVTRSIDLAETTIGVAQAKSPP
jgi:hypothetical protein